MACKCLTRHAMACKRILSPDSGPNLVAFNNFNNNNNKFNNFNYDEEEAIAATSLMIIHDPCSIAAIAEHLT